MAKFLTAWVAVCTLAGCSAEKGPPPVCIDTYRIDHTTVPNDETILFTMTDRRVYRATILDQCVGLTLDTRGFTYVPTPPQQICANLQTIVLNTSHQVCEIGPIVRMR